MKFPKTTSWSSQSIGLKGGMILPCHRHTRSRVDGLSTHGVCHTQHKLNKLKLASLVGQSKRILSPHMCLQYCGHVSKLVNIPFCGWIPSSLRAHICTRQNSKPMTTSSSSNFNLEFKLHHPRYIYIYIYMRVHIILPWPTNLASLSSKLLK